MTDPNLPPLARRSGRLPGVRRGAALRDDSRTSSARGRDFRTRSFVLFDAVVAFDHPRQQVLLLTTIEGPGGRAGRFGAIARLDRLETIVCAPRARAAPARAAEDPRFVPLMARESFLDAVAATQEAIPPATSTRSSSRSGGPRGSRLDPFDVYRALRVLNPSPYLFYLETREATHPRVVPRDAGALPTGEVETRPIAGTVARGQTPAEDERSRPRCSRDPKERAEHVMLVDLARNDLGRVCEIGSVRVARYAAVEKYSHVQHLVSEVRGRLRAGAAAGDALAACFPAGTLTGAPKIRAMEIIDELEAARRGVYGGRRRLLRRRRQPRHGDRHPDGRRREGPLPRPGGRRHRGRLVAEKEYGEAESKAAALFRADRRSRWSGSL